MKALIDPSNLVNHIVGWELNPSPTPFKPQKYLPIYESYPNSARVAQVTSTPFDVAPPLFWVDCADDIVADQFYYDTIALTFNVIVNTPYPQET